MYAEMHTGMYHRLPDAVGSASLRTVTIVTSVLSRFDNLLQIIIFCGTEVIGAKLHMSFSFDTILLIKQKRYLHILPAALSSVLYP